MGIETLLSRCPHLETLRASAKASVRGQKRKCSGLAVRRSKGSGFHGSTSIQTSRFILSTHDRNHVSRAD